MKDFFNSSTFLKIFAIILALFLWFYVAQGQNPVDDKLLEVPVQFINLPEGLAVSQTATVKVRVEGTKQVLDDLLPRDIEATVNMSNASIGRQTANIEIDLPEKVQLVSVNPLDILVEVQKVATLQSDVSILYDKAVNETAATLASVSPSQVIISGPEDVIKSVQKIYVNVNTEDLGESDYLQTLPVQVEDAQGQKLNSLLTIEPEDVSVFIPYVTEEPTKTVAVEVPLSGTLPDGYMVTRVLISPTTAVLQGEYQELDKISTIRTVAVDITDAKSDVSAQPTLVQPDNVTILGESSVNVIVKIEEKVQRTFDNIPVTVRNPAENYQYALEQDTVSVTLEGPKSLIEELTAADITVYCDVEGAVYGQQVKSLTVNCPSGTSLYSIDPMQMTVEISRSDG